MNEEKQIPIKRVRCYTPSVTNPIHLKKQRDVSKDDYKQSYHVANDGNYLMAIYEGLDAKGKIKRDFEIVNNLEAGKYFKYSVQNVLSPQGINEYEGLIPQTKMAGKFELALKLVLKTGLQVVLWENNPDEIWELNRLELNLRVYRLVKFDKSGRLYFRHHEQAKQASDLKEVYDINWQTPCEQLRLPVSKFNAIIEGIDFKLNILGQIEKINT